MFIRHLERATYLLLFACVSLYSQSAQHLEVERSMKPTDLIFSEELTLPGYKKDELGKIEYPSLALDKGGNLYISYDYTSAENQEGIYLNVFSYKDIQTEIITNTKQTQPAHKFSKAPVWAAPLQVSSVVGTEYASSIAVAPEGTVWIVWSARRNGMWEIYGRTYAHGSLGEELRLTSNDEYDFRPRVMVEKSGRVWVVWERGTKEKHIVIVAKYFERGTWSEEFLIEDRPGYAYRPTMLEASDKTVWFAWDHTEGANADVYIRSFRKGKLQAPVRVASHPALDNKPALTWYDNKLWIAWTTNRRGDDDWGIIRYTMVRAYDGKKWSEPLEPMPGVNLKSQSETQSYEFPTLTFDKFGRLYLFTRHDHAFNAATYEGASWVAQWNLDDPAWGIRGFYVQTVWESDTSLWMARRDRKTITLQRMTRPQAKRKTIRLKTYIPTTYPATLRFTEAKGDLGPTKKGGYHIYYGDLHVHTAYSDGSGSFDDVYTLYKNVYRRDFVAITDHDALRAGDNHFSPGEWAYLKALNEIYNRPGEFVAINGYEWTHSTWSGRQDSASKIGHKNVYFRGGEESPFFSHKGPAAYDAVTLFKTLHNADAIAFPHHPAWGGMTWEDHDPEIETNYEIVSIHGANEYMGNLPIPHRGGMPGTFARDGLASGAVIGFVGATDSHGLYYHAHEGWREDPYKGGLTGVLLDVSLTREDVWEALKARRNYATSGEKYYIEFAINGFPMGSVLTVSKPPVISFEVKSDKLLYAHIIRNNKERFISGPVDGQNARYIGMVDETIQPGKNYYYLRVVYKDGTLAWSSPIWVEYKP